MPNGFTFYGDLLGIASAYRLSSQVAYEKLDLFYVTVFNRFETLCDATAPQVHVHMFSDSVVMWGEMTAEILGALQQVYIDLIDKNLLLRGAVVDGALEREPRVQAKEFRKFLPTNDTLARAVGLEKTVKGARLLIESRLAHKLLHDYPQWLTLEGYIENIDRAVPESSVLRRICPSPSGTSYELLYFWRRSSESEMATKKNKNLVGRLKEVAEFQDDYVADHLHETLKLLRRSEVRHRRTLRELSAVT